ncbi:hypothetical protein [Roseomonas sp. AR75]|uniref:hypothetical protein n=1 Tax=Roseomonas sp. AR75 TaxID=2562311 RepID=UPI0010BF7484|nr:hypothetical protein [Roseomonas sp. AR75]
MASDGADDTVRLPPGRRALPAAPPPTPLPSRRGAWPWIALTLFALVAAGGAALFWQQRAAAPAREPVLAAPPPARPAEPAPLAAQAPPAAPSPPMATEAEILANDAPELVIRRFAANPDIVVLDFPTLAGQARMLNRVAALVEKSGLPRDRVLDDAALDEAERAAGGTADTFYYGHNYRAADLARFFALADAAGIGLNAEEERLRALLGELGWLRPDAHGALVSVPHAGVEPWLDARARGAMLRHELSHGEFFTRPAYAALVWRFWREMLTEEERAQFRLLLAKADYDPALEEVMANEAQAFLFHTPDDRFFRPGSAGLSDARIAALRAAFMADMPEGWLREAMTR